MPVDRNRKYPGGVARLREAAGNSAEEYLAGLAQEVHEPGGRVRLPDGAVGVLYAKRLAAWASPQRLAPSGSPPLLRAAVTAGALPPGVEIPLDAPGLLEGVPTDAGDFTFTIASTDGAGAERTGVYRLVVVPAPAAPSRPAER